jgi:hypothetical protein
MDRVRCEFERFTSGGAFICSRKCQTLVSHPAKPGVYLTAIKASNTGEKP